jgi:UDP-N-acetylglucosamine 1-carboxyvinyltransferase
MRMGVQVRQEDAFLQARADQLKPARITFEYPSVGATENVLLAAVAAPGVTRIINAALEPEVMDLITLLRAMGAQINILPPATIDVYGVQSFNPVDHTMMPDRLEAGALLLAAAITGGSVSIPQARAGDLDALLLKLDEMGHTISIGQYDCGVSLTATANPRAVSFKTGPFPGFPTDLQAPMMALQCIAQGESVVEETVYENRLLHVHELRKMGAQIKVEHNKATIMGVDELYGTNVIATDIRASCALVLAGLAAQGTTIMTGIHHWRRGYDALDLKLMHLGAPITVHDNVHHVPLIHKLDEQRSVKCV